MSDDCAPDGAADAPARVLLRQQMRERARARVVPRRDRRYAPLLLVGAISALLIGVMTEIAVVLAPGGDRMGEAAPTFAKLPRWFSAQGPSELPPPVVQPPRLMEVAPDTARQLNDAVPYAAGPIAAARSFIYTGSPENRAAARVCLAAAALYEAGTDPIDQYAVAQVVLNRVRHPAFPKTVCGVVFQGAERATGCQFTFACDGALRRRPGVATWATALASADAALSGFVFTPVGTATHYHTDWVFPYWQSSLTKLVKLHTHIFYRWAGWWGTPPAFSGRVAGLEHVDPRLSAALGQNDPAAAAQLSPEAPSAATLGATAAATAPELVAPPVRVPGLPAGLLKGNTVRFVDPKAEAVLLHLDPKAYSGSLAILANAICADKPTCLVVGFIDESAIPRSIDNSGDAPRRADFVFERKPGAEAPEMRWNCTLFPRALPAQCRGH